jgi:hypothetical protein
MQYNYEFTVTPSDTATSPLAIECHLAAGIIRSAEIAFPKGCNERVRVAIFHGVEPFLPTNLGAYYSPIVGMIRADPLYLPLVSADNKLYIRAWNVGTYYNHRLNVRFNVQDPEEPDIPQSLNALAEATGNVNDTIRRYLA